MMAKARRSRDSWTKSRFEAACGKAVRIMEERWALLDNEYNIHGLNA